MSESDLLALIRQGEGTEVEFKRDQNLRPESLAREIVAFANVYGGSILIGVDDDGGLSGVQQENFQEWLMDAVIGQYVSPPILPRYEEIIVEGTKIAVINVPMGSAKPYCLKQNDREAIYIRRGNTCQLAQREEIFRLYQSGGWLSIEKMHIDGCLPSELNDILVDSYLLDAYRYSESELRDDRQIILLNYDFIKKVEQTRHTDELYVTYFACALFAKKPCRFLPQAGARVIAYNNNRDDRRSVSNIVMDEVLDVSFIGVDEDTNLCSQVEHYLKPHISREHLDTSVSYARKTLWDYPTDVIRELIINAFAHRDWMKQNQVKIVLYKDCLEVTSPGALPNGMTVEKVKAGEQVSRNNKISSILRHTGFVEGHGMGIRHHVIPEMLAHSGREPVFEATEDYFRVILPKKEHTQND